MRIRIYLIGKVREAYLLAGEAEYLKRLKKNAKVELVESRSADQIFEQLSARECLIMLDEQGEQFNSNAFARLIEQKMVSGSSDLSFAIGSAEGWGTEARKRADLLLSLSQLTFPHQMVRLILLEQLYRAFSIIRGEPYHK